MFCTPRNGVITLAAAASAAALTAGVAVALPASAGAERAAATPASVTAVAPAAAPTAKSAPRAGVTVNASSPIAATNTTVVARGAVLRSHSPRTVLLQQQVGATWRTLAQARTKRSTYTLAVPTKAPGKQRFRVTAVKSGGQPALVSAVFDVAVGAGSPRSVAYLTTPVARWNPCTPITYRVNLAGAPKGAATDVERAISQISAASGLSFRKVGSTTVVPGSNGRDVLDDYPAGTDLVIAYAKPGQSEYLANASDVVAMGGAFYRPQTVTVGKRPWHEIVQSYVVLDRTQPLPSGFGTGNRRGLLGTWGQVLMHELGHAVGLDHPGRGSAWQIMHANTTRKPAVWGAGDLVGLRNVGAPSGCFGRAPAKAAGAGIIAARAMHHAH